MLQAPPELQGAQTPRLGRLPGQAGARGTEAYRAAGATSSVRVQAMTSFV